MVRIMKIDKEKLFVAAMLLWGLVFVLGCGPTGFKENLDVLDKFETVEDRFEIAEDTTTVLYVLENDSLGAVPEGVLLSLSTLPISGTVAVSTPEGGGPITAITYTPLADWFSKGETDFIEFQYAITAHIEETGEDRTEIGKVILRVTPAQDRPVSKDDVQHTPEDTGVFVDVLKNDFDVDNEGIEIYRFDTTGTQGGRMVKKGGGLFYAPQTDFSGSDVFKYSVTDGIAQSVTSHIIINVRSQNDAPVARGASFAIFEDKILVGQLVVADPDGDVVLYHKQQDPEFGALSVTHLTGVFIYTPDLNFEGTDSFKYNASDGDQESNIVEIFVAIAPVNDPPQANDKLFNMVENGILEGQVTANDVEATPITFTVVDAPYHGTITLQTDGSFVYMPKHGYDGIEVFTFKAFDGELTSNVATVTINIAGVNAPPILYSQAATGFEDETLTALISYYDEEGDVLQYQVMSQPGHGIVYVQDAIGVAYYKPGTDFSGTDRFTVRATDGTHFSNTVQVDVTILPGNDLPFVLNTSIVLDEDNATDIQVIAIDADHDSLKYALVLAPSHGTATVTDVANGWVHYVPTADYNGSDFFDISASDGTQLSDAGTVFITIQPVNDKPRAYDATVTVAEDSTYTGYLPVEDVDGDNLTYVLYSPVPTGTVSLHAVSGEVRYDALLNWNGTECMQFRSDDGLLTSDIKSLCFNVTAVNDRPIAPTMSINGTEDTPYNGQLNTLDPDGDAMTQPNIWLYR